MVRVREVVEHAEVDGEDANRGDAHGDARHHPVDAGRAGPPEHEQPDGHARALDARKVQPALGRVQQLAVLPRNLLLVDGQHAGDQRADAHGGEDGVGLLQREAVVALEHERDRRQRQVQDGPGEGDPEREPEHDGLGEEEVERAVQGDRDHGLERCALFVGLHFPADALRGDCGVRGGGGHVDPEVACCFALVVPLVECFCLAGEQNGASSLLEDDADEGDHDGGHDGLQVEDPAPGEVLRDEPGHQRAPACAEEGGAREQCHGRVALLGVVYVGDYAADHGGEGRAAHAYQEADHQHTSVGPREAGAKLADDEQDP